MKTFLLFLLFPMFATYTYTITMSNPEQAVYIVTNVISAIAWLTLGILVHLCRIKYAPGVVQAWFRPLTFSFKIFCGLSMLRYLTNILVVYHAAQTLQAVVFITNNISLAVAVGYASVYYRRIPSFLTRLAIHQQKSRRFTVIADVSVDAFLETDAHANIWYANTAAAEIFGFKEPKELLGQNVIEDLIAPAGQAPFFKMREDYLAGLEVPIVGQRAPTRLQMRRSCTQEFPAEMTVSRYMIDADERFCLIIRDITARIELENKTGTIR